MLTKVAFARSNPRLLTPSKPVMDLAVVNPASVNPATVNPAMVGQTGELPGGPHLPPSVLRLPPARDPWDYLIDKTQDVIRNYVTLVEEVSS